MDKIDEYEIQKTILFETEYGFALGCMPGTLGKVCGLEFHTDCFLV